MYFYFNPLRVLGASCTSSTFLPSPCASFYEVARRSLSANTPLSKTNNLPSSSVFHHASLACTHHQSSSSSAQTLYSAALPPTLASLLTLLFPLLHSLGCWSCSRCFLNPVYILTFPFPLIPSPPRFRQEAPPPGRNLPIATPPTPYLPSFVVFPSCNVGSSLDNSNTPSCHAPCCGGLCTPPRTQLSIPASAGSWDKYSIIDFSFLTQVGKSQSILVGTQKCCPDLSPPLLPLSIPLFKKTRPWSMLFQYLLPSRGKRPLTISCNHATPHEVSSWVANREVVYLLSSPSRLT